MRVYLIMADEEVFRFSFKHRSQLRSVMNSERDGVSVVGMSELEGSYPLDEGDEEPIFTDFGFMIGGHELVMRVPQTAAMRPMLEAAGVILPMSRLRDMRFEAFVCETKLDALDPAGMVYNGAGEEWERSQVLRYAFRPEVVEEATVFRVPGLFGRLFATDRFVDVLRMHGLTGLRVLPVWSQAEGGLVTFRKPNNEFLELPPEERDPVQRRARMRAVLAGRGR